MAYLVVSVVALVVSALTLFSGFGLGTLLMPVFALFFPVEVAVAATAVVHGANSLFKVAVVGRNADPGIVLRFGIPALLAALAGGTALGLVAHATPVATWTAGSHTAVVTPVKLAVAAMMLLFAFAELLPRLRAVRFDRRHLVLGGILSGFFGGFSGHQGALRAAFLTKAGLSTEAFVGTNAAIGAMVDIARIAAYAFMLFVATTEHPVAAAQWPLIATGIAAAFAGVLVGKRFLHKVTMESVQVLTGVLLLGIALALGAGLV